MCTFRLPPRLRVLKLVVPKCKTITGALNLFFSFFWLFFFFWIEPQSCTCVLTWETETLRVLQEWASGWNYALRLVFLLVHTQEQAPLCVRRIIRRMSWFIFFFQEDSLQQTLIVTACRCCVHYLHTLGCHVFLCHRGKPLWFSE